MIKKTTLLLAFIIASAFVKAQITSSNLLNEEKINQILINAKNNGIQNNEIAFQKKMLHQKLNKQNEAIANGTFAQRTITPPPHVNTSACTNPGFENGTNSDWNFFNGDILSVNLPCNACPTTAGAINTVVSALSSISGQVTSGTDYYGHFPVVAPGSNGGSYSLLLNDVSLGGKIQKAQYSFVVTAASNNYFTYQYAIVLQDGGHPINEQAYFSVEMMDVTTHSVIPCSSYEQSVINISTGTMTGWSISTSDQTVYYKPWTSTSIDLSAYIGDTVAVNFIVSDCNQSGHFGYAYIDAACGTSTNLITASNPLCLGDSTTLSGPTGFSTYNWAGPVTGTSQSLVTSTPGNYTLSTTSAGGCVSSFYYTLNQISSTPPIVSIHALNDSICAGTPATLIASGADTYSWSTGTTIDSISIVPTNNTTYTVTGANTINGCVSSATQLIHLNGLITIHASKDSICAGATTTLTASGVNTYTWSNNATTNSISVSPTTNTAYSVTGTDSASGCVTSATQLIHINQIGVLASADSICHGTANITLTVTGGVTSFNLSWDTTFQSVMGSVVYISPTTNTTYTVTSTIDGCNSSANIGITITPGPSVNYVIVQDSLPYTWDLYPNYPPNMASVTWSWGDGSTTTGIYPTHIYNAAGAYNICVYVTDSNGCIGSYCQNDSVYRLAHNSTSSNVIYVNIKNPAATGINQFAGNNEQITVYPNPANEMLYVSCKLKNATLYITDILGNKIKQFNVESDVTTIDVSSLSKGVYFLNVKTADSIITKKFIVQR